MAAQKGDYIGFTYNGTHSSELGIVRTSDGSRFNENLLPTMQDKTVTVPGRDGSYYFGSTYTQRQFSISFAYDSLTEKQIAEIRRVFGDKGVHDLIFDEAPYKIYSAKVTGTATLKYIPFAEGDTGRLYKGEGTIQFTCYYPFARYAFSNTDTKESLREKYPNIDEWWEASHIADGLDASGKPTGVNFGDVSVPFELDCSNQGSIVVDSKKIEWNLPNGVTAKLNTRTGLALVKKTVDNKTVVYNNYFTGDLTVKLPVGAKVPGAVYTCEYF